MAAHAPTVRIARKAALLALAAAALLAPAAPAAVPDTSAMVRVGTHRLFVRRAGAGAPVVVIDAGLADGADRVRALQDRLAAAARSFGDRPLVVIASGRPNPAFGGDAAAFQRDWIAQSRVLAARSKRGRFVVAEGASHQLVLDAPDLVAERILEVVREARRR